MFRHYYAKAKGRPKGPMDLGTDIRELLRAYCEKQSIPEDDGERFFLQLQEEAMVNPAELANREQIKFAAQRLWTSTLTLCEREFCFIINFALRDDSKALVRPVATIARAINQLCVENDELSQAGAGAGAGGGMRVSRHHPPDHVCYRGGGFNEDHRRFFEPQQKFRQPAYLATSFSESKAREFIRRSKLTRPELPVVLWRVRIDPDELCKHVNLVKEERSMVAGEQEYLFAPYSVFTVRSAEWAAGSVDEPHVIELDAAVDNRDESEDLQLAPWS